jgi:hypothetical protein
VGHHKLQQFIKCMYRFYQVVFKKFAFRGVKLMMLNKDSFSLEEDFTSREYFFDLNF